MSPAETIPAPAARPRVLMVSIMTPPWHFAGAGNQAVLLARELLRLGFTVGFVTGGGERPFHADTLATTDGPIPVMRLFGNLERSKALYVLWFNLLSVFWWLRHFTQWDVVHIHGGTHLSTLVWILLARLFGKKSLYKITCAGVDDLAAIRRYPVAGPLAYRVARMADGYVALAPYLAEALRRDVPEGRVFLLTNGVDNDIFRPPSPEEKVRLRHALGLPETAPVLVYAGGINPRKNVHFLADCLGRLRPRYPDLLLVLVGPCKTKDNAYADRLRETLAAQGLSSAVVFTGEVGYERVAEWLQSGDVFVFASTREGQPSSPVEAMACGLPTVIAALPGVTDWIYPNAPGAGSDEVARVVPADDIEAFSQAVSALLDEPSRRHAMGERAADYARQRYAAPAVAARYADWIYPALVQPGEERMGNLP